MVQLLTIKYTKEEERLLLISNTSGVFIGIPISLLLSYSIGFFMNLELVASSSIEWTMFVLKIGAVLASTCWITTIAICLVLSSRRKNAGSMHVERMFPGTLIFPLTVAYGILVMALVIFPLCFFLFQYLSLVLTGLVGALALLPFVIVIVAVLLPETPAGRGSRRFLHRSKRRRKKSTKEENM